MVWETESPRHEARDVNNCTPIREKYYLVNGARTTPLFPPLADRLRISMPFGCHTRVGYSISRALCSVHLLALHQDYPC